MTSIAKLLQEYSKESAELEPTDVVEDNIDPVEELEEIAELEEEVDESEGAVLEGEGGDLDEAVHTLIEATESLESSLDFLERMHQEHGGVTELGMRIFNASIVDSMEARGIPFEALAGDAVFSAEDAQNTGEAKEGIFKRIWAMIKAAFQRVREWITRFFAWFRTSGAAVKKAAEKLLKAAEAKKAAGAKADGKKYNQRPFTDLIVYGKVDPLKSVEVLIQATNETFASAGALVDTSMTAIDVVQKAANNTSGDKGALAKLFGDALEKTKRAYIKELTGMTQKQSLAKLPGERVMETKIEPTKKGFRAKVSMIKPENKLSTEDRWVPVMSLEDIISLSKQIIRLVDGVDKAVENFGKKFEKTKAFDSFVPKADGSRAGEIRELASLITQGTTASRTIVSEFSSHVFPIAKRAYAAGLVNVRQYK